MSKCRNCNAEIMWRKNEKSRQLAPIDAVPSDQGNVQLIGDDEYRVLNSTEAWAARTEGSPLHINHFQTCTNPPKRAS